MPPAASVLVIDDDSDFRLVLCDELEQAGYHVEQARDGHAGVERLQETDVDVIVLDVEMPGLKGHDVIRETRKLGFYSEVVVMTAYPQLQTALECMRAGVFDFLEKPFSPKVLLATLGHAVQARRLHRTTALYQATRDIFEATDPEELPQRVVETALRALDADDASLMLPDGAGGLTVAYSHGLPEAIRAAVRVRVGEGIAGRVAQDRRPALLVGSPERDPRFPDVRRDSRVRSSIVYPLAAGDRLVGVLNLNRTQNRRAFRETDLELASVFASQSLLALENVSLMRRLLRAERLAFVGKVTAEISHEINNPTAFVIANLEFLRENLPQSGPLADDLQRCVNDAMEGAHRIAKVVQDMRALLRGDEVVPEVVDLNEAVRFALRIGAPQLQGIAVETRLAEDAQVLGSEGKLGQVFLNLLVNAAQALAGRRGGRVGILTERQTDRVSAIVWDNGPGIPRRDQGRIFDAFFSTKSPAAGSGLGLSISREIVRRHGGELSVESVEGQGSRFSIVLPAAPLKNGEAAAQEERLPH